MSQTTTMRRLTCRDHNGKSRLLPGANLMDVIDRLCLIEERGMGVLTMGPNPTPKDPNARDPDSTRCRECAFFQGNQDGYGKCINGVERDSAGKTVRGYKRVMASRSACEEFEEVSDNG